MKKRYIPLVSLLLFVGMMAVMGFEGGWKGSSIDNTAYDATSWDGNLDGATKDALRDKIETLGTGDAPKDAKYIVQQLNGTLTAEQAMGALGTGAVWNTTTTGVQSINAGLTSIGGLTETNGGIAYGTGDNTYSWLAAGTADYLLQGNGAGAPSWTNTPTVSGANITGIPLDGDFGSNGLMERTGAGTYDIASAGDIAGHLTWSTGLTNTDGTITTTEDDIEGQIFDADAEEISGPWEWQDNVYIDLGDDRDFRIGCDGTDLLIKNNAGTDLWKLTAAGNVETVAKADPYMLLKDSDAPGTDKDVAWVGAGYVDGADESENADFSIYTQQGGAKTEQVKFDESDDQWEFKKEVNLESTLDADGVVELGDGGDNFSVASDGIDISTSGAITNGTFDANATGNNLKKYDYLQLINPHLAGAGLTAGMDTTNTTEYYGQVKFANDVDVATNYCEYRLAVPPDLDTSVALTAVFHFRLGGADVADHDYVISHDTVAASADYTGTLINPINLDYTADGSGADGDHEQTAETTLTDWKDNLTAGNLWVIRVARDGDDGTNDASTVDSYSSVLVIKYGVTQ